MARIVGLDFGTTNSALAILDDNAAVRMAGFPTAVGVGRRSDRSCFSMPTNTARTP